MEQVVQWFVEHGQLVQVLLGLLAPMVVGFITTCKWSAQGKAWLAMAVAVVFGLLGSLALGQVNVADLAGSITIVWAASQAFYWGVLKPAGINVWLLEKFGRSQ